jgi:hypothetical protein
MPLTTVTNETSAVGKQGQSKAPGGYRTMTIPIQLASMTTAAADLITNFIPAYRGKIVSMVFHTTTLGTGAGASQNLNWTISGIATTGGVINLTLAGTATLGAQIAASAITALNEFSATDTISLKVAAGGTVFTAGNGALLVTLQNYDF